MPARKGGGGGGGGDLTAWLQEEMSHPGKRAANLPLSCGAPL